MGLGCHQWPLYGRPLTATFLVRFLQVHEPLYALDVHYTIITCCSSSQAWCIVGLTSSNELTSDGGQSGPRRRVELSFPQDQLPGELYSATMQCRWQFGASAATCQFDFATVRVLVQHAKQVCQTVCQLKALRVASFVKMARPIRRCCIRKSICLSPYSPQTLF